MKRPITRPKPIYTSRVWGQARTVNDTTRFEIAVTTVFPVNARHDFHVECDTMEGIRWSVTRRDVAGNLPSFPVNDPEADLTPREFDAWLFAHAQAINILRHSNAVLPWPRGMKWSGALGHAVGLDDIISTRTFKGEMTADEALALVLDGKDGLS